MRLFSMLLAAAMIGFLIRELGRPNRIGPVAQAAAADADSTPVGLSPAAVAQQDAVPADPAQFRKLLELAGWDAQRFAALNTDGPLSDEARIQLAELLWRLRTFDAPQLAAWAHAGPAIQAVTESPREHAGELVELVGQVTQVERRELPADVATRLEMPAYFECKMKLDGGHTSATLITGRVPDAWLKMQSLDEPAEAAGVFVRMLSADDGAQDALFVSREIAWHPAVVREQHVSRGAALLGELGVDLGTFDSIRQRGPITAGEREAFFQMLDAVGKIGANQLSRVATQDLDAIQQHWSAEEQRLAAELSDNDAGRRLSDRASLQLAHEVQTRAAKGLYSVAPLFNDPQHQVGELVLLDGNVRRVQRINVSKSPDGDQSDVARRFGIDHYYEIDLFTDDSQNNPVVFVVRDLPPGLPVGDRLDEPVRIAGFFFKSWSFQSRRATLPAADGAPPPANLRQFAPLLIGRSPILIDLDEPTEAQSFGIVAAGLFLLLLGVVWVAGWWLARDDRRFVQSTLAKQFSLADGESLNDLDFDLSERPRENE